MRFGKRDTTFRERAEECRNLPPTAIYDIDEEQEQGVRVVNGNVVGERSQLPGWSHARISFVASS
jgi:hypothetical protein